MVQFSVVPQKKAPKGTKVTHNALMPKIVCCFEKNRYKVYVGRECVRTFKHIENAIKKHMRLHSLETAKAKKIIKAIGEPIISENNTLEIESVQIGFDNVI